MSDSHPPRAHEREQTAKRVQAMIEQLAKQGNVRKWAIDKAVELAIAMATASGASGATSPLYAARFTQDDVEKPHHHLALPTVVVTEIDTVAAAVVKDVATWIVEFVERDTTSAIEQLRQIMAAE